VYLEEFFRSCLLGSFNHGSMANALPQAIGAQLTYPERQGAALSGDGGLAMLMGDLLSLRQLDLPVKIVVFKNNALGSRTTVVSVEAHRSACYFVGARSPQAT